MAAVTLQPRHADTHFRFHSRPLDEAPATGPVTGDSTLIPLVRQRDCTSPERSLPLRESLDSPLVQALLWC